MILFLLLAAVAGWAAWRGGHLRTLQTGDVAAAVAALCGVRLLGHGEMPAGLAALAGAGGWF